MPDRREDNPRGDESPEYPDSGSIGTRNLYDQVAAWYREYLGREGGPDEINGWLQSGQTIDAIQQGIQQSDEANAFRLKQTAAPIPGAADRAGATPPTAPPLGPSGPGGGGGGGGGLGNLGGLFTQPFPGVFTPPAAPTGPPSWLGPAPQFRPPSFPQVTPFAKPTLQDALSDPGYQFAATEGQNALERSAAAKGTLGTSGTLKDILAWGGNYAQQRYGDVFNRAKDVYNTNYQTQFSDPYNAAYKSALDVFSPQLDAWKTQGLATQRQGEIDYQNAWDRYLKDYDIFRNRQLDLWPRVKDAIA